jgi:hypothetical protein
MTKDEFRKLFDHALATAIANAEQRLQHAIPANVQIMLHGAEHRGDLLSPSEAAEALYLGEDIFYVVIDVMVIAFSAQSTQVFMAASGHEPRSFDQTWNDPPGSGPFKQVMAKEINFIDQ